MRFPRELHDRALEAAHDRDTSINHLVVKALYFYLDRLPPLDVAEGSNEEVQTSSGKISRGLAGD